MGQGVVEQPRDLAEEWVGYADAERTRRARAPLDQREARLLAEIERGVAFGPARRSCPAVVALSLAVIGGVLLVALASTAVVLVLAVLAVPVVPAAVVYAGRDRRRDAGGGR